MTTKRTQAGRSRLALKAPCTLTLTAPAGFATRADAEQLSLYFKRFVQMMFAVFQIVNIGILPEAHIH